ncbi:PurE [Desulforapulum autotrophicum HRM2]|uniref:PurE n=1 Tax=Desulforapulum autotrophicum (strain ATCC 43914 / DSM 3382 / VKM B-1955 / HRM2) TaxID=177437 RepID=C0QDD5_DESAH|nr:nickel pincer cofactor biosynthesis protein LarB [Desulforapulum autotrophicum]ACN15199.1 PurE [Desulforapulum autotrophicum HRM2]
MNQQRLKEMLDQVAKGVLSPEQAETALKDLAFESIDYAHIDHHRSLRKGFPEVIFGQGKTAEQIIGIMQAMAKNEEIILITRMDRQKADQVRAIFQEAEYDEAARILLLKTREPQIRSKGEILVITAGTSDIPVAKEAMITAKAMGNRVNSIFDVGVAGIHRLFAHGRQIQAASVLVVVAGMEGALPSVVAGMVRAPVIAVPTSVGYGTSFGGMTALLGMLNSCSSNVAVVNIDNGFGAGFMAATINQMPDKGE